MSSSRLSWAGAILVLLGLGTLLYGGFSYPEERTVAEVGPFEASTTVEETVNVPPELAGGLVGVGATLLLVGVLRNG